MTHLLKVLILLMLLPLVGEALPLKKIFEPDYIKSLIHPPAKLREYDRFFSPLLFHPYRDQLREFVKEELLHHPELVSLLEAAHEEQVFWGQRSAFLR